MTKVYSRPRKKIFPLNAEFSHIPHLVLLMGVVAKLSLDKVYLASLGMC